MYIWHYFWGSHCANWRRSTETAFAFLILRLQSIKSMRAHFYYGTHWVLFANFVTFSLFIIFNALEYKIDWNNLTCCLIAGNIFFFCTNVIWLHNTHGKTCTELKCLKTKTKNHFKLTHRCLIWCKLCWSYGRYWHISHSENYLIEKKMCQINAKLANCPIICRVLWFFFSFLSYIHCCFCHEINKFV